MPTDDLARLVAHYDRIAPRYDSLYRGESRLSRFYRSRQAAVRQLLEEVSGGGRALEIGCASGQLVDLLLAKELTYEGIDISSGMIDECRRRFGPARKVSFRVGDVRDLPYEVESFDIVVSLGVIEYVSDEGAAVAEMARVLKGGGILILAGIAKWSPRNLYNRLIDRKVRRRRPASIVNEYHTVGDYRGWMSQANLDVLDVSYFGPARLRRGDRGGATKGSHWFAWMADGFLVKARKRGDASVG